MLKQSLNGCLGHVAAGRGHWAGYSDFLLRKSKDVTSWQRKMSGS